MTTAGQHLFLDWIKNNALSIALLLGGFALTVWQLKSDLGHQSDNIADLKSNIAVLQTSINSVQQAQQQEAVTKEDFSNQISNLKTEEQAVWKAIEELNQKITNIDSIERTLETNLQLINQQIGFLSTGKNFLPMPTPTPVPERYHH